MKKTNKKTNAPQTKEFFFLFVSGGWNSVHATNKQTATTAAKKKAKGFGLKLKEGTVKSVEGNEKEHAQLMAMFW